MNKRGRPKKGTWISTSAMCEDLGVSPDYLLRRKELLKPLYHWRNISQGYRPTYKFHRERVQKFFEVYWSTDESAS